MRNVLKNRNLTAEISETSPIKLKEKYIMQDMDISKQDSTKRGRSETRVSNADADTSLFDYSTDNGDVNPSTSKTSKEANLKDIDSKDYYEELDKGKPNTPKYAMKGNGKVQSHKKSQRKQNMIKIRKEIKKAGNI